MAASARISYNNSPTGGMHLAAAARYLQLAINEATLAKQIAEEVTAGGATAANLEGSTEFGAASGKGQALYDAIAALKTNADSLDDVLIARLYQG